MPSVHGFNERLTDFFLENEKRVDNLNAKNTVQLFLLHRGSSSTFVHELNHTMFDHEITNIWCFFSSVIDVFIRRVEEC